MAEEYLSVPEAAELLDASESHTWRLIRQYNIERFKRPRDRRTYVRHSDIDKLRSGEYQPREASAAA